jgi:hypothetical protein
MREGHMIGGSITMPRVLSPDWSITSKTLKSQDSVPAELRERIEGMVNVPVILYSISEGRA